MLHQPLPRRQAPVLGRGRGLAAQARSPGGPPQLASNARSAREKIIGHSKRLQSKEVFSPYEERQS